MKSTLTKIFAPTLSAAISALGVIPVSAANDICSSNASKEVRAAAGCPGTGSSGDDLPDVIVNILNAVIGVAGFISVVWIIIGGVTYITSSGDAGKTKKARDTILYACIGLVICVLAFAIVNFVIIEILKAD